MAEISAQVVQQLREKTGLGLMQCKKALAETNGDLEKAVEHLRKQGASVAAKRVGKETKEGKIVFATVGQNTAALEVNCETDFVAASDDFTVFAQQAVKAIATTAPADLESIKTLSVDGTALGEMQTSVIAKVGENIALRRFAVEKAASGEWVETYSHMGGKIGVIVKVGYQGEPKDKSALTSLTKDLAMQVAASAPIAVESKDIPSDLVEKEREIARELTVKEGKTGDLLERVIEGKVTKFFKENCLVQQVFIKDSKTTVEKLLASSAKNLGLENLRVVSFHRLQLGQ